MILLILFVFGLVFGSFVNALVWRIHEQSKSKKKRPELSIVKGRSQCTYCGHTLSGKDLVPVFSWLSLRGKCRYCKKPIPYQYPAVELLTASLFVLSYSYWPYELSGGYWLAIGAWLATVIILVALLVYDARWMLLPNRLVAAGTVSACTMTIALMLSASDSGYLVLPLVSGALLFSLFYILFQVSKGKWIGGGDVKLAFALGLIAGSPLKAVLLVFIASLIGTIIVLPMLSNKRLKKNSQIAFGPLLIVATFIVFFAGDAIINWYTDTILYL